VRSGVLATLRAAGLRVATRPSALPRPRAEMGMGLACGAPGARHRGWHEVGVTACAAAALAAAVVDPRQLEIGALEAAREAYVVEDRLIERPASETGAAPEPALHASGIHGPLRGSVLLAVGDHVGTDRILPWGARARPAALHSERLARLAFAGVDPQFASRAVVEGGGWIVAGRGFGEGSVREQAVLVMSRLGVRGVLARSFDADFRTLLRQHGVLALRFTNDWGGVAVEQGDELEIPDLPDGLEPGKPLVVRNLTQGTQYTLHHDLDAAGVREVRAGGLLATVELDETAPA
jgi:aconitate hydratase